MTIDAIDLVVTESGKLAKQLADHSQVDDAILPSEGSAHAAQWMQVKMLAEIAKQLHLMNDGNGVKQTEE